MDHDILYDPHRLALTLGLIALGAYLVVKWFGAIAHDAFRLWRTLQERRER